MKECAVVTYDDDDNQSSDVIEFAAEHFEVDRTQKNMAELICKRVWMALLLQFIFLVAVMDFYYRLLKGTCTGSHQ